MEDVISELQQRSESVPVPLTLADMDDIIAVEEQLLISLDNNFRHFLLTVSNVIYGTLEPVTVTDPQSHTYLPEVAAVAWSRGLPRHLIPLCETNASYYCVDEHAGVVLWKQGELVDQTWTDVWAWARQVWLNS